MAVPNSQTYIISGALPGGEKFSCGWWGPLSPTEQSAAADAATVAGLTPFQAFLNAAKVLWGTGTSATQLTVRQYGSSGQLTDVGSVGLSGYAGSVGAIANQVALVVSFRTANFTRSGRGRMYLPATGTAVGTNGKLAGTSQRQAIADAAADLMDSTDGAVASEKLGSLIPITTVLVGDVPDTVRSRRDKLVESYVSASV